MTALSNLTDLLRKLPMDAEGRRVAEELIRAAEAEQVTTLYVAYLHDRHVDPEIRVFRDRQAAIDATREWMNESMAHPENIEEEQLDGYELFLSYSVESDHAFVQAVEVE